MSAQDQAAMRTFISPLTQKNYIQKDTGQASKQTTYNLWQITSCNATH